MAAGGGAFCLSPTKRSIMAISVINPSGMKTPRVVSLEFLASWFMPDTYRANHAALIFRRLGTQEKNSPLLAHLRRNSVLGRGKKEETRRSKRGKAAKKRPQAITVRICRGCSRLADRVPRSFVVGTRPGQGLPACIWRIPDSSAGPLPCAFPVPLVNSGGWL